MTPTVLLDLETVAIDTVGDYIEEPSAPGNYKNPDTIAAYVVQARRKLVAKAALKPDLGRIAAISWQQVERDTVPRVLTCKDEGEERGSLEIFWDDFRDGDRDHPKRIVTFSGSQFDLTHAMRRSLALEVPHPRLRVDRGSPHLDLARVLSYDGLLDAYSLKFYMKRYALDDGIEDPFSGADIGDLIAKNLWDDVVRHCVADVERLYRLAVWCQVIEARAPEPEIGF